MSPDQLRTLLAIVEEGSFDAAAARLHVTPSAVSQRVRALEQAVGQVVVQRTSPAAPTPAGEMLVRHARQLQLLDADLARELGAPADGEVLSLPVAVNADSLATWFLPALTSLGPRRDVVFDLRRADQALTIDLLRRGEVVAAVTSTAEPVQGARSTPLGVMRYLAVCSPAYAQVHLGGHPDVSRIVGAPLVDFDRTDRLQQRAYREAVGRAGVAPRHYVPTSADFARAVVGGMGWGLLPVQQCAHALADGSLLRLEGARDVAVPLFWQRWALGSALLDELTTAVVAAARDDLESPGAR